MPFADAQWARIEPLLPDRALKRGGRWRDHREVIDAIAWKFQTGSQWVHLPEKYGSWEGAEVRPCLQLEHDAVDHGHNLSFTWTLPRRQPGVSRISHGWAGRVRRRFMVMRSGATTVLGTTTVFRPCPALKRSSARSPRPVRPARPRW
ncbi:transposase [Streptomyces roseifaciens]|uniref:transposase n=1 Tax=Streptomyces roseifaciens TaxID=1488406 RepID=UPI000D14D54B